MMNLNNQMVLILFQIFKIISNTSLTKTPPIHIYINRTNKRLVIKIKHGCKLELQTPETMNLFGSTKNLIEKTKNGEKVPGLEVVEIILFQCSLVDSQYQKKSEVLYSFTSNSSYAYLRTVEPRNLESFSTCFDSYNSLCFKIIDNLT